MSYLDKEKQRTYQKEWIARRRHEFFRDKVCANCGSNNNLELDHKDRNQKVSHRIWSWNSQRRQDEISKCQVLCNDCHKEKTAIDMNYTTEHGRNLYRKCKCDICVNDHALACKEWRIKTGYSRAKGR